MDLPTAISYPSRGCCLMAEMRLMCDPIWQSDKLPVLGAAPRTRGLCRCDNDIHHERKETGIMPENTDLMRGTRKRLDRRIRGASS
jgi:hypothetical protein